MIDLLVLCSDLARWRGGLHQTGASATVSPAHSQEKIQTLKCGCLSLLILKVSPVFKVSLKNSHSDIFYI